MYSLIGTKWGSSTIGTPSGDINWHDDLTGLPTTSGSDTADLIAALEGAFQAWENAAAISFVDGGATDLTVTYSSFSSDSNSANDGAAATASWSGGGQPVNARITFNSDFTWNPVGGFVNFYGVALHEIGHIIGLGHVPDPSEIMYDVIGPSDTSLGDGDVEGAQYLYGTDAGDVPVTPMGGSGGGGGGGGAAGAGLLLGLLALIIGLFSGGAGAAAMMAAGRVASGDDDEAEGGTETDPDFDEHYTIDADGAWTHYVYLPDLPLIDFGEAPRYDDDEDDLQNAFFI